MRADRQRRKAVRLRAKRQKLKMYRQNYYTVGDSWRMWRKQWKKKSFKQKIKRFAWTVWLTVLFLGLGVAMVYMVLYLQKIDSF